MWELHFSRCTEPRYTWGIPYVAPLYDGRYRVDGPSRSESVGEAGGVEEALSSGDRTAASGLRSGLRRHPAGTRSVREGARGAVGGPLLRWGGLGQWAGPGAFAA
ncbi:DUF6193 family natural product biosynthesis protein [Streptomyces sp. BRA346]|uniref:DUF6193 family natural product biosynthesis protein n=1 Tax=Streptomyces sp. BRA346 TaxID=2878199 RepID=UPI0040635774